MMISGEINKLKTRAMEVVDDLADQLKDVLEYIHNHPETCFKEYQSSKILVDKLLKYQFQVEHGVAGLPTAFTATYRSAKPGPNIGIFAEYDALPIRIWGMSPTGYRRFNPTSAWEKN